MKLVESNGHRHDYNFGSKRNWRRWNWNRIVERLAVPPKDAMVLYLAGGEDLDRPIALERGFSQHNLIAVDRSSEVVDSLRKSGRLAINATLLEVVEVWPKHIKIHVLIADFCSGLNLITFDQMLKFERLSIFDQSVFSLNNMRGRDGDFIKAYPLIRLKHRALKYHLQKYVEVAWRPSFAGIFENLDFSDLVHIWMEMSRIAFTSYKSTSGQVFDSSVFFPLCRGDGTSKFPEQFDSETRQAMSPRKSIKRSCSAVLAHRTRRLQLVNF